MMGKRIAAVLARPGIAIGLSLMTLLGACGDNSNANGERHGSAPSTAEFALYALSRGKGVPAPTRAAFEKAASTLEGARQRGDVLSLTKTRIGLEGEVRLCVRARDAATAAELQAEVRAIAGKVELFNIVEEPCTRK